MSTGYEVTEHLQPQAFRCPVCGGLVLTKEPRGPNSSRAACPCGSVRLVGAHPDVVTVDDRKQEAIQPVPVLVGVVDKHTGEWDCSILVDRDVSGPAVLDLHDDQRLIIETNPPPCQKVGAAHVASFCSQ